MIAHDYPVNKLGLFINPTYPHHYYLMSYQPNHEWIIKTKYQLHIGMVQQITDHITTNLPEQLTEDFPLAQNWTITPIPLHWRGRLKRRFDLNIIVAKKVARILGYRYDKLIKNVSAATQGQQSSRTARIANAKQKFKLRTKNINNHHVIIFDDVVATGATMQESEKLLRSAGAKNVVWLSIAH